MIYLIEGWDTYASRADSLRRWVYQAQGNGGTLSAGGMLMNGSVVSYCNAHINPLRRIRLGFHHKCLKRAPSVTNSSFLHLTQGGETNSQNQIGLGMNPDGTVSIFYGINFSGLGGTTLGNGTTVLDLNTDHWLELDVVLSTTTAGSVELRIDGVPELTFSGIRTSLQANPWVDRVSIVAGAGAQHLFGAMYVGDGADGWIGSSEVYRLALSAATAQKDFVLYPTTGEDALNMSGSEAAFVASDALSASDLYAIAPLPMAGTVHAVQVSVEAFQNDAANRIKALQPVIRLDGASRGRSARILPSALPATWYTEALGIYQETPADAAWGVTDLAALEVGFRVSPFIKGFNFRQTASYVIDPPSCTYVLNDLYPTTRGGVTFGWDTAGTGTVALNRTTANPKYAGVNCQLNNGAQRTFRADVPAPGRYQLRLILGDSYTHRQVYCEVLDGSAPLFVIDTTTDTAFKAGSSRGLDAIGQYNAPLASWEEFNRPREIVLAGTELNIVLGSPAAGLDYSCIAHMELVALDQVDGLTAVAPEVRVTSLYVEALVS